MDMRTAVLMAVGLCSGCGTGEFNWDFRPNGPDVSLDSQAKPPWKFPRGTYEATPFVVSDTCSPTTVRHKAIRVGVTPDGGTVSSLVPAPHNQFTPAYLTLLWQLGDEHASFTGPTCDGGLNTIEAWVADQSATSLDIIERATVRGRSVCENTWLGDPDDCEVVEVVHLELFQACPDRCDWRPGPLGPPVYGVCVCPDAGQ